MNGSFPPRLLPPEEECEGDGKADQREDWAHSHEFQFSLSSFSKTTPPLGRRVKVALRRSSLLIKADLVFTLFYKHLRKVFLSLPDVEARQVLEEIYSDKVS